MMESQAEQQKLKKTALAAAGLIILTAAFVLMFYKISYAGGFFMMTAMGEIPWILWMFCFCSYSWPLSPLLLS